jgi:hypothetical protein
MSKTSALYFCLNLRYKINYQFVKMSLYNQITAKHFPVLDVLTGFSETLMINCSYYQKLASALKVVNYTNVPRKS